MYRYSTDGGNPDKWERMLDSFADNWKEVCMYHVDPYTERCEGSFIECKEASVVWQYRDCDPELGKSFAQVITLELENALKTYPVDVINGKGYVEVKAKGLSKGAFVSHILKREVKNEMSPDFILSVGDDISDEKMFKYLNRKKTEINGYSKNVKIHTVTVGKKPTSADSFVENPDHVMRLLEALVESYCSNVKRTSVSTFNLRDLEKNNDNDYSRKKSDV